MPLGSVLMIIRSDCKASLTGFVISSLKRITSAIRKFRNIELKNKKNRDRKKKKNFQKLFFHEKCNLKFFEVFTFF